MVAKPHPQRFPHSTASVSTSPAFLPNPSIPQRFPISPEGTAAAQELFLAAYAKLGNVSDACRQVPPFYGDGSSPCLGRDTVYGWRERDPSFRARLQLAEEGYADLIETIARQRLLNPEGNRGSDWLLQQQLRALRPHKYGNLPVAEDVGAGGLAKRMLKEARRILTTMPDGSTRLEETVTEVSDSVPKEASE